MLMNSTEIAYYNKMIEGSNQRNINKYRSGVFFQLVARFSYHIKGYCFGVYTYRCRVGISSINHREAMRGSGQHVFEITGPEISDTPG